MRRQAMESFQAECSSTVSSTLRASHPETWAFTIGGYRPAEKWLKDRKGRVLSDDDINHYRQIIAALAGTNHLMHEIDELIEQHGGWPKAFD